MTNADTHTQYFATCPKGLESLLLEELQALGGEDCRATVAGVYFSGTLGAAYRACLWSRLANKVLLPLTSGSVRNADELYELVKTLPWQEHLSTEGTLLVDFSGQGSGIRNTQFGAVKVKDAIVDCLREQTGMRPSVAKVNPDVRINVRLNRGRANISLDLSGDSLHRRGYRQQQGEAPLKENLAAAILIRAGWCAQPETALLDPMCGSGTFLIEAALMAADIAPGLYRSEFAFERWRQHQPLVWAELIKEARERRLQGLARDDLPEVRGYDANLKVIRAAEQNITRAGLDDWLRVSRKELREFKRPTHTSLQTGLIVCNPPYGERLGELESMKILYAHMGERFRDEFTGWRAAVFTGNPELGKQMGLRAHKKYKLFNGTIPSELLLFDIANEQFVSAPPPADSQDTQVPQISPDALTDGAQGLVNRLQKNQKKLKSFLKRSGATCYRLYDADIPEYACAIDVYQGVGVPGGGQKLQVHVQEYQPPRSVDEDKAAERFAEIQAAVPVALNVAPENVSYKQRRRNKGTSQYEKLADQAAGELLQVQEGQARLLVNLWQYLDSGVFLDHRPLRLKIAQQVKGKRFLNLFCYTAAASVQAAVGGARFTLSVDMSQTYLNWARKNLALNGLSESKNRLEQADCLQWLQQPHTQKFDMIMLDPPSFSNSKRMADVLDVQRDHVFLLQKAMALLETDGVLYFSNNLRSFKLDEQALEAFDIKNITRETIPEDFVRNQKIHHCWEVRHRR
ncbi:bifunctional 23S rRNA (guanine(2069)-N(7))-methyltransferase RlmK/23S rRNA (guanine(2445)-N(2))-methyltransferase RlmL [Gilvimarinus sp. DA14]|uniref:bifunctional 23S rRNA (guanine(2069)-N(7))-methyltransferase RlmK/23S rRNA (guanine(2445)-N(2))-methyltransferase RlmL n=1 Tax=Gilvimarinus sp. DA14 TaxID=2956798 RepID=UPI0020B7FD6F|nr:bifunctional 23S rRNA (guanine(2069)-N(7))-methyltransferase RlmK/23S rRNA (guanine(2445)-N(2))-methyltransferase RlmL [Gilvimarinus sp. DA14]UTF60475.1 bifunctional 23S rRNA (guanine(2069)-N(7))-methyltransferase RlmK/23S rRNA (guanine(2445)-N(2))-methyltransferase RlmL [Gilvimarinus sp. DA14]